MNFYQHVFSPNFRSICDRNGMKTSGIGAINVPMDLFACFGPIRHSLCVFGPRVD